MKSKFKSQYFLALFFILSFQCQSWGAGEIYVSDDDKKFLSTLREKLKRTLKSQNIDCPEGYVLVPGNELYGGQDFCVMKYNASNGGNGRAVSVTGALPWVRINRHAASAACRANGPGYELISNAQWMTIARDIESNAVNWSRGVLGDEFLSRGNSNSRSALAASGDENPYFGLPPNQQGNWTHKRTHVLSNGEIIWDLAANVWKWVLDPLTTERMGWQEFTSAYFAIGSVYKNLYAPLGDYDSSQNVGYAYMWNGGAVYRSGYWGNDTGAGIFTVGLHRSPTETDPGLGFLCTYVLESP